MKIQTKILLAAIACTGLFSQAGLAADASATQTVTYEVVAINEIAVSGSPTLTVDTATAGQAPDVETDESATYDITTNEIDRKITGHINTNMPEGVTLAVTLVAPTAAEGKGKKTLSTVATDLVSGISTLNETGKQITYELSATSAAGVVTSATKTVTLTITQG